MIRIEGSRGEGGGQIIRSALSMSAITGNSIHIINVRARRNPPGLKNQHLAAARLIRKICRGRLESDHPGSTELKYIPGKIVGGRYDFDIGTAGSVTLLAQSIIPVLLMADKKSEVILKGGTHVLHSPGYDYFSKVFIPAIRHMGADVESELVKPGYYPKGGGTIKLRIRPSTLEGRERWQAQEREKAIIRIANLPLSIAMREKKILVDAGMEDIKIHEDQALSPGNVVTLWKGLKGSYVPGEKGKRAEMVAKEAIRELRGESGDVDKHLADQLLIYAALAKGTTRYDTSKITDHFTTNSEIISRFVDLKIAHDDGKIKIG